MKNSLDTLGINLPSDPKWVTALVAAGVVVAAFVIGWLVARKLGPKLQAFWTARVGGYGEGIGPRLPAIVAQITAAMLLAVALRAWPWPPTAEVAIGFGLAAAAGLFARAVLRGVGAPSWAATLVAVVIAGLQLSTAVGSYAEIRLTLDAIGFDIGARRLSLLSLITILIIVAALYAGTRIVNRVIAHSIARTSRFDATQKLLAEKLAGIVVLGAAILIGIDLIGIDLTALAVFSGALGLAVGFGMQKTVGNLIAGIILLMDRSIKPGDVIVVGDSFGTVSKIGVRAVSVITRDGKEHLIPNENLMTEEVENWSYSNRNVRVHIPVGVSYNSDIKQAQRLMVEAAKGCTRVLPQPQPTVWLIGFGDSSVDFEILAWISDPESGVGNVQSDVLNRLWDMFKEAGIEIPFPQRDLHLKSLPDPVLRRMAANGSADEAE